MMHKIIDELQSISISQEELILFASCLFGIHDSSLDEHIVHNLVDTGYVAQCKCRYVLTQTGERFIEQRVQTIARLHAVSTLLLNQYFYHKLSHIEEEIIKLKAKWREARDEALQKRKELISKGKDKAAVRKDKEYRLLRKKQEALRTRLRHKEKEYNKKLSYYSKQISATHLYD